MLVSTLFNLSEQIFSANLVVPLTNNLSTSTEFLFASLSYKT